MKLYEEFNLYETMWDEPNGIIAIVYAGNFRNENKLEQEAAKANPANTIVVKSFTDLIRQYTNIIDKTRVRLYIDTEGRTELEKACADLPIHMKKELFNTITLLEWQAVDNTNKAVASSNTVPTSSAAVRTINAKKLYSEIFETVDNEVEDFKTDSYDNSYDIGAEMHYELQWNLQNDPEDCIDINYYEEVLKTSLDKLLKSKGYDATIKIDIDFDVDTLSDANLVNLTVSYNLPN